MSEPVITKQCSHCKEIKPLSEFYNCSRSKDGKKPQCKDCRKAYQRSPKGKKQQRRYKISQLGKVCQKRYKTSKKGKETERHYRTGVYGRKANNRRQRMKWKEQPAKMKARDAVKFAIRNGILPPIQTQNCSVCGIQAEHYHHDKGYAKANYLKVIPVCVYCHQVTHN